MGSSPPVSGSGRLSDILVSDIMEIAAAAELPKYGGTFVQCEDGSHRFSMALGASYAGQVRRDRVERPWNFP